MKSLRPLLFTALFVGIIGLACGAGNDIPTQPPPTQSSAPQVEPPTAIPPTEVPPPTEVILADFFTEEFDQDPGEDWVTDILGPGAEANADSVVTSFEDGKFRIELPEKDLYFYYTYAGNTYEDVRLDLRADNRGVNTNNVSLTCRNSRDGWYEWSVGSGGDWYLYAVTDKYNLISNGGTLFLKQGKEVNEYSMICDGRTISLFINGSEIKQSPITDNKYSLRDGTVGFNISSLGVIPVIVEVEWFKISEP